MRRNSWNPGWEMTIPAAAACRACTFRLAFSRKSCCIARSIGSRSTAASSLLASDMPPRVEIIVRLCQLICLPCGPLGPHRGDQLAESRGRIRGAGASPKWSDVDRRETTAEAPTGWSSWYRRGFPAEEEIRVAVRHDRVALMELQTH